MIIMICIIRYILWYIWYDICFYYYNISPKILYWISWLSMVFPHLISLKFELFFQSLFCGSSSASFACLFFLSGFAAFWFSIYHHPHLYAQIFALYCGFSPHFPDPHPPLFCHFPSFLGRSSLPFVWISIQCECRATQRAEMKMFKWKIDWILMNFSYTQILTCTLNTSWLMPICVPHTPKHFLLFCILLSSFFFCSLIGDPSKIRPKKLHTQKLHSD